MQERSITRDEISAVLQAAYAVSSRDHVLLLLLFFTCAPAPVVANLTVRDFEEVGSGQLAFNVSNWQTVWFPAEVDDAVRNLLERCDGGNLFPNLTPRGVAERLKTLSQIAGLEKPLTPEAIRRFVIERATITPLHPN